MKSTIKTLCRFFMLWSAMFAVGSTIGGCASIGTQNYSFEFDLRKDHQHAAILDYWYGNSRADRWIFPDDWYVKQGTLFYFQGVFGAMSTQASLYVKWRDTETGKIYEDTVDLRHRFPKNIDDHTVYLMIRDAQLYVYLVSPELRPLTMSYSGPSMYARYKVTTIYPDQAKP